MQPLIDSDVLDKYIVYPDGFVYSKLSKRFLKGYTGPNGYKYYTFFNKKKYYAHRLVAYLYCDGYSPELEVNHKDGNRSNCNFYNLEWVTSSENLKHSYDELDRSRVSSYKHPNQKLSDEEILEIFSAEGSQTSIAEKYGTSPRTVFNIKNGIRHKRVTERGSTSCSR